MRKEWERECMGERFTRKTQGVFISLVHQGDVCTQPMDRQVYRKVQWDQGCPSLPFSSLLSLLCVCGSKATCLWPCFLPKPLIHFPLSFCPPAFFVFSKVWEEKLRLYIVYRIYITPPPPDPGPTSEREGGGSGEGRGGRGEREWASE